MFDVSLLTKNIKKPIESYCLLFKESPSPRPNGDHASIESRDRDRDSIGLNGDRSDKPGGSNSKPPSERPPSRSGSSSSRSTPSLKTKDVRPF